MDHTIAPPAPPLYPKAPGDAPAGAAPGVATRTVLWLSRRWPVTVLLTCGYVVFFVLAHDLMQQPAYWVQGRLAHRQWNNVVASVAVPVLLAMCFWAIWKLRRHPRPAVALLYLALTVGLAAASFHTLLVMNIEVAHFPQYAILAILLFALRPRFGEVVLWCTLIGLLDEGYQYFYLYADRGIHFDFNDVLLNAIGAGFGVVFRFLLGLPSGFNVRRERYTLWNFFRSPAFLIAAALLVGVLLLTASGVVRLLPRDDPTGFSIVLRRGGPSTMFWTPTTWGKTFHEIQPVEWLFAGPALVALYLPLDFVRQRRRRRSGEPALCGVGVDRRRRMTAV